MILHILPVLLTTVAAAPNWGSSWGRLDDYLEILPAVLPDSLQKFINSTYYEGRDELDNVYDDLKDTLLDKTEEHVDEVLDLVDKFLKKWTKLTKDDNAATSNSRTSSTQEDETRRDEEEIDRVKNKLDILHEKLQKELEQGAKASDSLRETILQSISDFQRTYVLRDDAGDNPLRGIRLLVARLQEVLADTTEDLRTVVGNIFDTFNKFDYAGLGGHKTSTTTPTPSTTTPALLITSATPVAPSSSIPPLLLSDAAADAIGEREDNEMARLILTTAETASGTFFTTAATSNDKSPATEANPTEAETSSGKIPATEVNLPTAETSSGKSPSIEADLTEPETSSSKSPATDANPATAETSSENAHSQEIRESSSAAKLLNTSEEPARTTVEVLEKKSDQEIKLEANAQDAATGESGGQEQAKTTEKETTTTVAAAAAAESLSHNEVFVDTPRGFNR